MVVKGVPAVALSRGQILYPKGQPCSFGLVGQAGSAADINSSLGARKSQRRPHSFPCASSPSASRPCTLNLAILPAPHARPDPRRGSVTASDPLPVDDTPSGWPADPRW